MSITHLVTHSGGFHADELLSSVVLMRLYPDADLIRSRDREWITPAAGKIIYDVGGTYDSEAQIFDHHQRPSPVRDDEQPFSSFGLIWKHYGRAYLAALAVPEDELESLPESWVARCFPVRVPFLEDKTRHIIVLQHRPEPR